MWFRQGLRPSVLLDHLIEHAGIDKERHHSTALARSSRSRHLTTVAPEQGSIIQEASWHETCSAVGPHRTADDDAICQVAAATRTALLAQRAPPLPSWRPRSGRLSLNYTPAANNWQSRSQRGVDFSSGASLRCRVKGLCESAVLASPPCLARRANCRGAFQSVKRTYCGAKGTPMLARPTSPQN